VETIIQEAPRVQPLARGQPRQSAEEVTELPLTLPLFDEERQGEQHRPAGEAAVGMPGGDRVGGIRVLRVLVVDDNEDAADSSSILLQLWGHDVRVAYSGQAALESAATFEPDVFLLDIGMPRMSGLVLARRFRGRFSDALLVAVTGYADATHRVLGAEAGFDLYLVKPVKPSDLETLLALEINRLKSLWTELPTTDESHGHGCGEDRRAYSPSGCVLLLAVSPSLLEGSL
jgi:CheY-like chemotaxis protein